MPRIALAERRDARTETTNPGIDTGIRPICPVEVEFFDPQIVEYCEAFMSKILAEPSTFPDRIYIPNRRRKEWLKASTLLAMVAPSVRVDPFRFIRAHINAGRFREPQTIAGIPWDVPAIGIQFDERDRVDYANLDLDGSKLGPSPREVTAYLRTFGIHFMTTPGSGSDGRYRVLIRLATSYRVDVLNERFKVIFGARNWHVAKGSIEIFPSSGNGRMPFGFGGCEIYDADLIRRRPYPFAEMLATYRNLVPFDLENLYWQLRSDPLVSFVPFEFDVEKNSSVDAYETNVETYETNPVPELKETRKSKGKKLELTPRERREVERYRTQGIEPDQRLDAYRLLTKDDFVRGLSLQESCESMKEWIRGAGIARSNDFQKRYKSRFIVEALTDIPRHVRRYFAIYAKQTERTFHLSRADIVNLAPHVERVAALLDVTIECAGMTVLRLLPRWKGYPDAIRTEFGIVTNCSIFRKAAGNNGNYAEIRDEFGFFRPTSGYLPGKQSVNGKGKARRWACDFAFDEHSPDEPIAESWTRALYLARNDKPSKNARK